MSIFEEYGAWGLDTLVRYFAVLYKREIFCDFVSSFLHSKALLKMDLL